MNKNLLSLLSTTFLITIPVSFILANAKTASANTTFTCVRNNTQGGYSTIAILTNGRRTSPLINWRRLDFAPSGYTPEKRCLTVTNRLNGMVSQHNGLLSNLFITSGIINNLTVMCCITRSNPGCTEGNVLLTFSPDSRNSKHPNEAIQKLINFSKTGTGAAIEETGGRSYVNLEKLVEAGLQANQNSPNTSPSQTIPSNSPTPSIENPEPITPTQPSVPVNGGGPI